MDTVGIDASEAAMRKGERARVFLDDGTFQSAWDDLQAELESRWRASPIKDAEGREEVYRMLRTMDGLRNVIETYVQHGYFARNKIEQDVRDALVAGQ